MRVLVLGGTVFLGRHVVDALLKRGHEVTLFHRGRNATHRPDELEEILGDRGRDLHVLAGRRFDAVVDTCAYLPGHVAESGRVIVADHYTLVSSVSVYADMSTGPLTEDAPLHTPPAVGESRTDGAYYGPQKVGCERALAAVRGDALVQRVGLLVGPYDPTDRFTYWATRMRGPGPVLVPDVPNQPVQVIDVRDLAGWTVHSAEAGVTGVMNVDGPRGRHTFGELLRLAGPAEIHWADEETLLGAGVAPWTELPLWLPERFGMSAMMDVDTTRAEAAGLRARPIEQTLAETAAWAAVDDVRVEADYGTRARSAVLNPQRERELLATIAGSGHAVDESEHRWDGPR